jgi:septal ring factor EnvC (AmiA/AmiB activator)
MKIFWNVLNRNVKSVDATLDFIIWSDICLQKPFLYKAATSITRRKILLSDAGMIGGILKRQLEPIKSDLEYIKKQVDAIRTRVDGLNAQLEKIEETLKKVKVA